MQSACRATDAPYAPPSRQICFANRLPGNGCRSTRNPTPVVRQHMLACVRGSKPAKGHKSYPCLLGGLRIDRPKQVWCADITYLPMRKGFLYLVAVMDWFTRKVLAWRISNMLEAEFCLDALNEAIPKLGPPEIMNTDQGSQFTSFDWTDRLKRAKIKISLSAIARNRLPATDGRQSPIPRQHLHRASLAVLEIRMRLPARLGNRFSSQGRRRALDHLLHPPAAQSRPWRPTARRGLLQPHRNRSADAGSSLNYPGNCPRVGE
jgi:putative transposase